MTTPTVRRRLRYAVMWLGLRPQVSHTDGRPLLKFGLPYAWFWLHHPVLWWRLR